jgi:6-phosphofructokinase 1
MNTAIEMIDRLRDTCESHARCSVVEVMGRDAGDIALQTGIAVGATTAIVPEIPFNEEKLIEKIKTSRALGKRNFIIVVAEGMGSEFGKTLTARIEQETGVESRFARLAHVIRGGIPSLRDRLLATRMGEFAVEELFKGRSNEVICDVNNEICAVDIDYALILDRMYKNKLKEGDLDRFTPAQITEMQAACARRRANIETLYATIDKLGL